MGLSERDIQLAYLTPNPYSRPRRALHKPQGIVLHYPNNPGTSAWFNRNWFESLKAGRKDTKGHYIYGSAHVLVGLCGEIIQAVPWNEIAHHAGPTPATLPRARVLYGDYPNGCLLGIELCHIDRAGKFTIDTWNAGIDLCASLCDHFDLEPLDAITTHHFITGKECPKWFVDFPDDFMRFKRDVHRKLVGRCT